MERRIYERERIRREIEERERRIREEMERRQRELREERERRQRELREEREMRMREIKERFEKEMKEREEKLKENIKNNIPKSLILNIDKLELEKMNESKHDNCTICLEAFKINDACIKLPCSHLYHEDCIISWFIRKKYCPLCQKVYNFGNNELNEYNPFEYNNYYDTSFLQIDNNRYNNLIFDLINVNYSFDNHSRINNFFFNSLLGNNELERNDN